MAKHRTHSIDRVEFGPRSQDRIVRHSAVAAVWSRSAVPANRSKRL